MSGRLGDYNHRMQPGARIGRYRLLAPLASGGMADVWAAKPEGSLGLSRTVAVKVVRAEYALDEDYTRMLIDEATMASAIHHPNVCDLLELDRDGDLVFMVMEWVAGDSLAGILHQGSVLDPLPAPQAVRILADACAGTHAAHEAVDADGVALGVVHRDISPPNILLSLQGQVKVSDFGIAKARNQLHARTRTGEVKGKFAYIPPEQILGQRIDRRADIYALGCVLYVATLGLRPFGSGPRAIAKIMAGQYRRPRELSPTYPEDLEAIIVRALDMDRERRFPTADQLRHALESWLARHGHVVTGADTAELVRARLSDERRVAIEELRKLSRASAMDDLVRGLEVVEREQTPTAGSGLISVPATLAQSSTRLDSRSVSGTRAPEHSRRSRPEETTDPGLPGAWAEAAGEAARAVDHGAPTARPPQRRGSPDGRLKPESRPQALLVPALLAAIVLLLSVILVLLLLR